MESSTEGFKDKLKEYNDLLDEQKNEFDNLILQIDLIKIFLDEEIEALLSWYKKNLKVMHPIELATRFQLKFEEIHPFTDGNGRVGREIFNFQVGKMGYPQLNFDITKRDEYLDGLERANHGDYKPIINYITNRYSEQIELLIVD